MVLRPPDDYVAVHSRFFELLEANDTVGACDVMAAYLERHDAKLSAALQVLA
jgi:hypothetical protein